MRYFKTLFLDDVKKFLRKLDTKTKRKVLYNIDLAEQTNDPKIFKKLDKDIWEFRTKYSGMQIRLLAFWDKTDQENTLVIATHGFIKKVDKVPKSQINRALKLKDKYYLSKRNGR